MRCHDCRHQVSVTAGTIFQDTRIPLRLWFQAMWWMTTQKNGASALGLQHILGLSRYETAWTMLHRLRRAMVRPGRDLLTGRVEVDECYLGGPEEDLPGRLNLDKTLVVVAAQEDGPGIGRIRMRQVSDASTASAPSVLAQTAGALCAVVPSGNLSLSEMQSCPDFGEQWGPLLDQWCGGRKGFPDAHTQGCKACGGGVKGKLT